MEMQRGSRLSESGLDESKREFRIKSSMKNKKLDPLPPRRSEAGSKMEGNRLLQAHSYGGCDPQTKVLLDHLKDKKIEQFEISSALLKLPKLASSEEEKQHV